MYVVTGTVNLNGDTSNPGAYVASNTTAIIYIAPSSTLNCYGGTSSGRTPGKAGINVPSNAELQIVGTGKLYAKGGNGSGSGYGNCSGGGSGGQGGGGQGGGGGGAGIGTEGAWGGAAVGGDQNGNGGGNSAQAGRVKITNSLSSYSSSNGSSGPRGGNGGGYSSGGGGGVVPDKPVTVLARVAQVLAAAVAVRIASMEL